LNPKGIKGGQLLEGFDRKGRSALAEKGRNKENPFHARKKGGNSIDIRRKRFASRSHKRRRQNSLPSSCEEKGGGT